MWTTVLFDKTPCSPLANYWYNWFFPDPIITLRPCKGPLLSAKTWVGLYNDIRSLRNWWYISGMIAHFVRWYMPPAYGERISYRASDISLYLSLSQVRLFQSACHGGRTALERAQHTFFRDAGRHRICGLRAQFLEIHEPWQNHCVRFGKFQNSRYNGSKPWYNVCI